MFGGSMKVLLLAITLFTATANVWAQTDAEKEYFDLLMMYLDADFEKLLKESEKYMDKDKTKRDPLPYLYASMAYYDISQNSEVDVEVDTRYPLREALKLAGKYIRYDRDAQYQEEGKDYIPKLMMTIKNEAIAKLAEDDDNRASYYFKQILRIDEADYSVMYMEYQLALRENDNYTAKEKKAEFETTVGAINDWAAEPRHKTSFLEYAMLEHADYLVNQGRSDAAKAVLVDLENYIGRTPKQAEFKKEKGL